MRLDHLGIAVRDRDAAVRLFADLLDAEPYKTEAVAREGVETVFFGDGGREGQAPKVELLAALGEDSPVGRFLASRGPGLHHIAFEVPDLPGALDRCRALGLRPLADEPRPGADGMEIVFLHPKDTAGVLVELCQRVRPRPETLRVPFQEGSLAAYASGPPGGPPLVVLHGALGSTALETDRLIRHWERQFRVVALDFPGHGRSDTSAEASPTWATYTASVEALFAHFGLDQAALFGFSMGGGVALAFAARHPEQVARLAVHAVNVQWDADDVERMVGPMDPERIAETHPFWARRLAETHGEERWLGLVRSLVAFTRGLPEAWLTDAELAQVTAPTLVSAGDADRYFELRHALHLRQTLPHARLWVLPGLDHPIQGVEPSSFARAIGEHLVG